MSSLKIDIINENGVVTITLEGHINEDSNFLSMKDLSGDKLFLNLKKITLINSCGIREWVEFQKNNFDFKNVIYQECSQVIVEQMNIVSGFIHQNGQIESFYAPYYNEKMDKEVKILIKPSDVIDGKAPSQKNSDGVELEFDDIEAQYFNFLKVKE